ncbi:hypothetical protein VNO80_28014 [Phaseolus coccineus]|uniref:Uncharacterized protein n=1 Tax=Phaseolus coccineus TaxID=3886 RepID=A0AAN9LHD0_PHACN
MWEGRQLLGTIFVRWRRKRFDCCLFLFSHRYCLICPCNLLKFNMSCWFWDVLIWSTKFIFKCMFLVNVIV